MGNIQFSLTSLTALTNVPTGNYLRDRLKAGPKACGSASGAVTCDRAWGGLRRGPKRQHAVGQALVFQRDEWHSRACESGLRQPAAGHAGAGYL
jgi:hypothetical protein